MPKRIDLSKNKRKTLYSKNSFLNNCSCMYITVACFFVDKKAYVITTAGDWHEQVEFTVTTKLRNPSSNLLQLTGTGSAAS